MEINALTLKFKEELTKLINNSNLPPVNVLLVMENIQKDVHNALIIQLQEEKTKEKEEKNK